MKRIHRAAVLLLCAALLPALCACGPVFDPSYGRDDTLRPVETAPVEETAVWTGAYDATDELLKALGIDLRPRMSAPALAAVRLEIDPAGRCALRCDYGPCADALTPALAAELAAQREEERDETPEGAPGTLAAGIAEELLPQPLLLQGSLSEDGSEIRWGFGRVSALAYGDGTLTLEAPELGALTLTREAADGS